MKCVICNPAMFVPTRDGWPSARQQLSLTWFGWAQNDERTRRNRSDVDHVRVKEFFIILLVLETGLIGVFVALDLFLFYFFWEATLIPMALLIGVYGHDRRVYAAVKFFLYTMIASVFMLAAILWLYAKTGTFDFVAIQTAIRSGQVEGFVGAAPWLFLGFFVAFAVKVPLFPVHTWLPDAHVEAPTAGSVLLAGVLLKMGPYGMLRFSLVL